MPITYYTQEEIDNITENELKIALAQRRITSDQEKREIIRSWILYTLMPENKSAKQLRQALADAVDAQKMRV